MSIIEIEEAKNHDNSEEKPFFPLLDRPPLTSYQKRQLPEKIACLTSTAQTEVGKILKRHGVLYSRNKYHVLVMLKTIPSNVLIEIDQFVDFCIQKNEDMDEYDKRINECKMNKNYDMFVKKDGELVVTPGCGELVSATEENCLSNIIGVDQKLEKDDWQAAIQEAKNVERVKQMVEALESNMDRCNKKKMNTKFINAKKRYSRKVNTDRKFDSDDIGLVEEQYII